MKDKRDLLYQIINKDNWNGAEVYDHYSWTIANMPPRMRIIVELMIEGYTRKQVAGMLKISIITVNWHLQRAKKRIFNVSF